VWEWDNTAYNGDTIYLSLSKDPEKDPGFSFPGSRDPYTLSFDPEARHSRGMHSTHITQDTVTLLVLILILICGKG